jgi:putative membrane protein
MIKDYNRPLEKNLTRVSVIVSLLVLVLVGVMRMVKIDLGIDFSFLPPVHALLNTGAAVSLIIAYLKIRRKEIDAHRNAIFAAMTFSALFLVCYVLYHFTTEETKYCGAGLMKIIYFTLLFSHIILAGLSLPFILITFSRGISYNVDAHRKLARWVYPVWLYVAITGPVCYLLLRPCYGIIN